jgi:hypothetical protein
MTWSHFPPSKPMLVYALYSVLKKLFFLNNLEGALNTKSRNSLFDRAYRRRNTTRSKNGSPQQRHLDNPPLRSQKYYLSLHTKDSFQVSPLQLLPVVLITPSNTWGIVRLQLYLWRVSYSELRLAEPILCARSIFIPIQLLETIITLLRLVFMFISSPSNASFRFISATLCIATLSTNLHSNHEC